MSAGNNDWCWHPCAPYCYSTRWVFAFFYSPNRGLGLYGCCSPADHGYVLRIACNCRTSLTSLALTGPRGQCKHSMLTGEAIRGIATVTGTRNVGRCRCYCYNGRVHLPTLCNSDCIHCAGRNCASSALCNTCQATPEHG